MNCIKGRNETSKSHEDEKVADGPIPSKFYFERLSLLLVYDMTYMLISSHCQTSFSTRFSFMLVVTPGHAEDAFTSCINDTSHDLHDERGVLWQIDCREIPISYTSFNRACKSDRLNNKASRYLVPKVGILVSVPDASFMLWKNY